MLRPGPSTDIGVGKEWLPARGRRKIKSMTAEELGVPKASAVDVTRVLNNWRAGDPDAAAHLMPLVYEELRRLARNYLRRERGDHTLQATALVHEAYLRLIDGDVSWQNRAHFYAIAAKLMR